MNAYTCPCIAALISLVWVFWLFKLKLITLHINFDDNQEKKDGVLDSQLHDYMNYYY